MEDDATQPSTQAVELQHRTTVESDPTILLVLHPASPAANDAVWYLSERLPQYVKPHATDALPGDICLRYTIPPKNTEVGYTFGRNPYKCDVPLGQQSASRRVSNVHFRIFINPNGVVMLEDCSTNGTWVDNVCLAAPRTVPPGRDAQSHRRRILTNSSLILLALGPEVDELKFIVGMKTINKTGWRMVSPAFNRGAAMAPPRIAGHAGKNGEAATPSSDNDDDLYALPDGWGGDNGPYQIMPGFIGKGAFAVVRKITQKATGDQYAVKIINKRAFAGMDDQKRNGKARKLGVLKEVEIMEQLNHPNIVQYFECRETQKQIYIRMEYIPKGDLNDFLKLNGHMDEDVAREATRQILNALEYVHGLGISHRDIKPDNILVKSLDPLEVKLSDFGLAKMIQNDETFLKTFCGTMLYLAPEVFPQTHGPASPHAIRNGRPRELRRYNQACDMWSLGCVLFVLLSGVVPFNGENQEEIQTRIAKGRFDVDRLNRIGVSPKAIDFLRRLLVVDPNYRMMEQEALQHPWLQEGIVEMPPKQELTAEEYVMVNALQNELQKEQAKGDLAKAIDEWEVVKDEIQAGADDRQIGLAAPSPDDFEEPVAEPIVPATPPGENERNINDGEDEVEDGNAVQDEDGDVEIEGSQEQFDRQQRQHMNLTLSQQRRPPMISRPTIPDRAPNLGAPSTTREAAAPSPRAALGAHQVEDNNILSHDFSVNGSLGESALQSHDFAVGLSQYADPIFDMLPRGQIGDDSIRGSSGVMGESQYHEEGDDDVASEQSTDSSRPSSSSSSNSKTYSHAVSAASSRAVSRRTGRRMSGNDGKSLAGMRTMVGNLQVASASPSILHRKGSGVFSEGGRVTKRKKSSSSFNGNDGNTAAKVYEAAMATIDSGGTGSQSVHDPASQQVPASDDGEDFDHDDDLDVAPRHVNNHQHQPQQMTNANPPAWQVKLDDAPAGSPGPTFWGQLIPLAGSLPHQIIPLVNQQVSYGRSSACTCVVTDIRVSKQHFAIKLTEDAMQPSAMFDQAHWAPQDNMKAWIKINGSNGITLNGRKVPRDNTVRLFDGDELTVFNLKDKNEMLGFKVVLTIGDHVRNEEDLLREREYESRHWLSMVPPPRVEHAISGY